LGVVLWAVVVVLAMGVEGRRTALRDMYCGEADCYSILNLERDATAREIKKAYRALALLHHPDRSNPDAEQRFQTIAVAYETLRDEDVRRDYDYYLDHPEQALHNMYRYYRHVQVPMTPIVVGVILFISTLQYVSQHTRHSFARRAITYDTKKRQQIKRELHDELKDMTTKVRAWWPERNARVDEEIVSRVRFTGAHAPPDISKLLAVQILLLPKTLLDYGLWQWRWYQKYTRGQEEYADEDKLYLMCRHLHMPRARFE
ncbi:uncharacterized protein MONBRDRAFT_1919, partial [Monosiga brevicollis MX1]